MNLFKKKQIKFCIDCKYFKPSEVFNKTDSDIHNFSYCTYPTFSLVNKLYVKQKICVLERIGNLEGECGAVGKFWEKA